MRCIVLSGCMGECVIVIGRHSVVVPYAIRVVRDDVMGIKCKRGSGSAMR